MRDLLLDLSSGLESFWVSPKYHTTPSLKLEASQSLKCDGSLTLRSSQTSKPMKLSFLGYRKKNCCNSGCKFFWLSLTYCRLEKLLDSSKKYNKYKSNKKRGSYHNASQLCKKAKIMMLVKPKMLMKLMMLLMMVVMAMISMIRLTSRSEGKDTQVSPDPSPLTPCH